MSFNSGIYLCALSLGALTSGCGSDQPASRPPVAHVASAVAVQAAPVENPPSAQELTARPAAPFSGPVKVVYVIDPAGSVQIKVRAGYQAEATNAAAPVNTPGAVRRAAKELSATQSINAHN